MLCSMARSMKKCRNCKSKNILAVEYGPMQKYRYDGVSEWWCQDCGTRYGRFCGEQLTGHEVEPVYCKGGPHPSIIIINEIK